MLIIITFLKNFKITERICLVQVEKQMTHLDTNINPNILVRQMAHLDTNINPNILV